jgi:hypothetical protein
LCAVHTVLITLPLYNDEPDGPVGTYCGACFALRGGSSRNQSHGCYITDPNGRPLVYMSLGDVAALKTARARARVQVRRGY